MKRNIFLLALVIFISCNNYADKNKHNEILVNQEKNEAIDNNGIESLEQLRSKYGDLLILESIYFIDRNYSVSFYENWPFKVEDDWVNFEVNLSKFLKDNPRILEDIFDKLKPKPEFENVLKQIKSWCETYIITLIYVDLDEAITFEKIVYEIKDTKRLVTGLLNSSSKDWESLSTSQIYQLHFDLCTFLSSLSNEDRVGYYNKFLKVLSKEILSNDK